MTSLLLDHFYKINTLTKENSSINATITFDVASEIFKGHFPDMPVVPGVCQTQMLSEIFSNAMGADMQLKTAASIKFLSLVDPTKTPQLNLQITYTETTENTYSVSAHYKWEETVFFKFKGIFAAAK